MPAYFLTGADLLSLPVSSFSTEEIAERREANLGAVAAGLDNEGVILLGDGTDDANNTADGGNPCRRSQWSCA